MAVVAQAYYGFPQHARPRGRNVHIGFQSQALFEISRRSERVIPPQSYLNDVLRALDDESSSTRRAAAEALGQMGEVVVKHIERLVVLLEDDFADVRRAAITSLGQLAPYSSDYAPEVADFLKDPEPEARAAAAEALGLMRASSQLEELRPCLDDEVPAVVISVLNAAARWEEDGQELAADVARRLSHGHSGVRKAAARALAAAGSAGCDHAELVTELLADQDNMVREAAVAYFESHGASASQAAGEVAAKLSSGDGRIRAAAAVALGHMKASQYASAVACLLDSPYEGDASISLSAAGLEPKLPVTLRRPQCAAALALALMGEQGASFASAVAGHIVEDMEAEVAASLVRALGLMGAPGASFRGKVQSLVLDPSAMVREAVCFALGELSKVSPSLHAAESVVGRLKDPHPLVRQAAALSLGNMSGQASRYSDQIARLLRDPVDNVKVAAARALAMLDLGQLYAAEVCRLTTSEDPWVRIAALEVVGYMGERGVALAEDVVALLADSDGAVREAALKALTQLGPDAKAFLADVERLCCDPLESVRAAADECAMALSH